ncbi:glycine zipper 2TM domain-containing protein [Acidovorax sp. SUPP950]|uniref:glycine zipper 2TM domain-containing protein n=1 Tax=unclassified Acidovorax TaxID=2684926 RepID=UPI002349D827|nr:MULTISPECIES: glycine zipper 2TM domain-containing protein [unclassified Acidovorax]WCM99468.1 glycine zipper 2TM domain-containing protein [Acidovorax sp. GBBC 1281]GKS77639.1 glycine zipper 2TM domain-containing protein [Acidovorax sp. SUPP950]GKS85998.1 glycine zipper 2TM domain-containing protein [Acidovorax sp. SUPP1855]GKS90833.1 glycine zipper 2TM domain-containing protein [Acidovorax sp. SUPP2539]GKS95265.1 glycine zipper 2TM domain-containing protein [Acidovorax sp. SUPP2825]
MKKIILLTALAAVAAGASAQEQGRVLSATPITEQVAIPQQVCGNETIYGESRPTGAGAVLGAIAGGATGNAIGKGSGRAAATAIGLIGGAVLGNNIEGTRPEYQNVQRCSTQTYYENRTMGYNVLYEYAGRQYTTRTQHDPGAWIPVSVQPIASAPPAPAYSGGYAQPGVVVSTYPGPPAYVTPPSTTVIEYHDSYGRPYYPPRPRDPYWR